MTQAGQTIGSAGGSAGGSTPAPSRTTGVVPRTSVDPTVIAGIAAIAATQVPGVRLHVASSERADLWGRSEQWGQPGPWAAAGAVPTVRTGLAGSLPFAADPEPPVRSWCDEPGTVGVALVVEVELDPDGSRPIPAVAQDVRREVAAAMTAMTRLEVSRCDVHVAAIHTPSRLRSPVEPVEPGGLPATQPAPLARLAHLAEQETAPALPQVPVPAALADELAEQQPDGPDRLDAPAARLPGDPIPTQLPRPRTGQPLPPAKPSEGSPQDPSQNAAQEPSHHG